MSGVSTGRVHVAARNVERHAPTCQRWVLDEDGNWWKLSDWLAAGSPGLGRAQHWHSATCETPEQNEQYALAVTGSQSYALAVRLLITDMRRRG